MPSYIYGDNMTKKTRLRFNPEFKVESAQLVLDQGYSVRDAAQAMSVQIVDRQKKIYRLESLFMESEKQCQYLQTLLQAPEASEDLQEQSKFDMKQVMAKVVAVFQDLPAHVPGWLKT